MFENIIHFFKNLRKKENNNKETSDTAKERLHLVLMQDRANVSADFLELMKQEIIEVIKKYIDIDEKAIDVRLTNKSNEDGTMGAPALYANIPIVNIKKEKENIQKVQNNKNENTTEEKKNEDESNDKLKEDKIEEKKSEQQEENKVKENVEIEKETKQEQTNNEENKKEIETNDNTVNTENVNA